LIATLDDNIKEFKFDVKTFNIYVQTQVSFLAAHSFTCTELLTFLFTAYSQVQDTEFTQHVNMYYFQYTNDTLLGQHPNMTRNLMKAMEQHYHRRVAQGTWNPKQVHTDKERIIALETTIMELKANNTPASNAIGDGKTDNEEKWKWKKVPPKAGQATTIKKNKKEYHWCPKHKQWCIYVVPSRGMHIRWRSYCK
jgi:hypothetical protein